VDKAGQGRKSGKVEKLKMVENGERKVQGGSKRLMPWGAVGQGGSRARFTFISPTRTTLTLILSDPSLGSDSDVKV